MILLTTARDVSCVMTDPSFESPLHTPTNVDGNQISISRNSGWVPETVKPTHYAIVPSREDTVS